MAAVAVAAFSTASEVAEVLGDLGEYVSFEGEAEIDSAAEIRVPLTLGEVRVR